MRDELGSAVPLCSPKAIYTGGGGDTEQGKFFGNACRRVTDLWVPQELLAIPGGWIGFDLGRHRRRHVGPIRTSARRERVASGPVDVGGRKVTRRRNPPAPPTGPTLQ